MSLSLFARFARKYFERNISVIPCAGKRPMVPKWQHLSERLPTQEEFAVWEARYSAANIGAVMGMASGLIALDIDHERHLTDLAIPTSYLTRRGKKGEARFFAIPVGCPAELLESFSISGFDFIGTSRQIILPPSIHPESNHLYVWADELVTLLTTPAPIITTEALSALRAHLKGLPAVPALPQALKIVGATPSPTAGEWGASGRNNRLKAVVQAVVHRGLTTHEAAREAWMTDLREHCTRERALGWGRGEEFEAAWADVGALWCGKNEDQWRAEIEHRGTIPLFLDTKENCCENGRLGLEAALHFATSIARTEERRGLTIVSEGSVTAPLKIDPVGLVARPKKMRSNSAITKERLVEMLYPKIPRPSGFMGLVYDECLRANQGDWRIDTIAMAAAITTMASLTQHRFVPARGTNCTNTLVFLVSGSGIGKSATIDIIKHITDSVGIQYSQGWKSSSDFQDEITKDKNLVALIDEGSSFLATLKQAGPWAVELQDVLTSIFSHNARLGIPLKFATSKAGKRERATFALLSPGVTMLLGTTRQGLIDTAASSIGTRGFMPRGLMMYQPNERYDSQKERDEEHGSHGPSQMEEITKWARDFVTNNPIVYKNGDILTNERDYQGAHSIERAQKSGINLTVPLEMNGPLHFQYVPHVLPFDPDAYRIIDDEAFALKAPFHGDDSGGGAYENRFGEWASKLSMLHALARFEGAPSVEMKDAMWGLAAAKVILANVKLVMADIENSPSAILADKVLNLIARGRNTEREIKKSLQRHKAFDHAMISITLSNLLRDEEIEITPASRMSRQKVYKIAGSPDPQVPVVGKANDEQKTSGCAPSSELN